jgi:hypothetical protein
MKRLSITRVWPMRGKNFHAASLMKYLVGGAIFFSLFALSWPFVAVNSQTGASLGPREDNTALNGTTLTYYQRPSVDQCESDCANNGNCKGFTWIKAGTYNPGGAAMCYLLSAVTRKISAAGHISAVKGASGTGASLGPRENNISLDGTRLTYYQRPSVDQCESDCANNGNCQGFTWIKAGTYNPGDAAMCYLLSAVTRRISAAGHISALKGAGGSGGGGNGGGSLVGTWAVACCNEELGGKLYIKQQQGNAFSGTFQQPSGGVSFPGGGDLKNGQLRGNVIEFDRREVGRSNGWKQHWSGQLVNDRGSLRMINGTWTGDYADRYPGRNNWHAEKQ